MRQQRVHKWLRNKLTINYFESIIPLLPISVQMLITLPRIDRSLLLTQSCRYTFRTAFALQKQNLGRSNHSLKFLNDRLADRLIWSFHQNLLAPEWISLEIECIYCSCLHLSFDRNSAWQWIHTTVIFIQNDSIILLYIMENVE